MAHFSPNTQVFEYPLIRDIVLISIFCLISCYSSAQHIPSTDKKANKFYHQAREAHQSRDFESAQSYYHNAIDRDPNFGAPYLGLAAIAGSFHSTETQADYFKQFVKVSRPENVPFNVWFKLAQYCFRNCAYDLGLEFMKQLEQLYPSELQKFEVKLLSESLRFAVLNSGSSQNTTVEILPKEVNRFYNQYFPVVSLDQKMLIYTKRDGAALSDDEDLVVSYFENDQWTPAESISDQINTLDFNEGACSISADGRTLVFTSCDEGRTLGSCDLFITYKVGGHWTEPENMGDIINSKYWDSQPSLSSDGRVLYFSSNRPGGLGKRDIWLSNYMNGNWTIPRNLGAHINGKGDDITPYIHPNKHFLIYGSESFPGFGGTDLFVAERENNIWQKSKNAGQIINSCADESSFFLNPLGSKAYFSRANTENRSEIAVLTGLDSVFQKSTINYVSGVVLDRETLRPVGTQIQVLDLNDSLQNQMIVSDSITGEFLFSYSLGDTIDIDISAKGYELYTLRYNSLRDIQVSNHELELLLNPIRKGKVLIMKDLNFLFDSDRVRTSDLGQLYFLLKFLRVNPDLQIAIEGHTDNTGSETYNYNLSKRRAEAVSDFLLENDIDEVRIKVEPYGSSQLIRNKDGEIDEQRSRRIAIRIL